MSSITRENTNELFASIGKLITSSLKLNDILDGIMKDLHIYFNPQHCSLLRYDYTTESIFFMTVKGLNYEDVKSIRLKKGEGIAGSVVETGESIFVPDTSKDDRFSNRVDRVTGFKTRSIIAVPVKFREKIYGVIEIINRNDGVVFTSEEHLVMQTIADFSAIAFANHMAYEEALKQSETDYLTGLCNNSKLDNVIGYLVDSKTPRRRNYDSSSRLLAVYIDLDNFKEINDSFGHREGDEVLKRVSKELKNFFRSEDMIFRVGGDEFLVLINITPDMSSESVIKRTENVLSTMVIESEDKDYHVKLSYGMKIGSYGDVKNLIHDADMKMLDEKKKEN